MKTLRTIGALWLCAVAMWAQSQNTAQIQGTVQDATGSAVPGAQITATQTTTGVSRVVTTGADGRYVLPNLPIGPYRMEVSKQGFATYVQTGIELQVATNPTVDVTLKLGAVSEQVQVEANAALVETEATGVGNVMETQRIVELPLNGRVATDLIQYTAGAIPQGVAGNGGYPGTQQFVIAGGQAFGVAFWLDGSVYNNPWDLANMPLPFPDALQEFKVETSSLTAANGVHAGGTVTGVTRSGSNEFHGDAFEFLRNGDLNARNFFAPTRDTLKRNQFGGTIGGPVVKNKLFFFFGYQDTLTRQDPVANPTAIFVPTAAMLQGDFTQCPSTASVGKISPSLFDPAALKLAALLPKGTGPCGNTSFGLITQVDENQYVGRGDYTISSKDSLFGRYIRTHFYRPPSYSFTPDNILSTAQGGLNDADQSWVVGETHLFSPNLVNQVRASVDRIAVHRFSPNYVSVCDLGVPFYCGYTPHQSGFTVLGAFSVGPGTGGQAAAHSTPLQLNDDISWVHGRHQINFGGGGEVSKMLFYGNVYAQSLWTFPSIPQFLLGKFSSNAMSLPNDLLQQKWFMNFYVQDTWKVSSRFTVNLGLRWEPFFPPAEINGSVYNFSLPNLIAGVKSTQFVNAPPGLSYPGDPGFIGKTGEQNQWNLFAPRVALAYDPTGEGKTVIRASYGISYDYVAGELMVNSADAAPYGGTEIWSGQFSDPFASNPGGNIYPYAVDKNAPFAPAGTYIFLPPNLKTPQTQQWNLVVQRQLGSDWLVSATYLGNHTTHLWDSYQVNPAVYIPGTCQAGQYGLKAPGPCSTTANQNYRRVFVLNNYPGTLFANGAPAFGYVDSFDDGATSGYNGLILAVQKRLSKGLLMNANYTWSHCIGDLSIGDSTGNAGQGLTIANNRRYDRSNCQSNEIGGTFSSDRRSIFNLTVVYQTPRFQDLWTKVFLSDWKVSGIFRYTSAYWVTPYLSSDVALTGATNNQRPLQVLQDPLCANPSPSCWINPKAFATPAPGTFSPLNRNNIPGPNFTQIDMSLSREFSIREGYRFEVRADAFNLPNSFRAGISPPSLAAGQSGLNTTFGTPTFGQITSALDPRIIQLAMKFSF
ncbi:MAG TPA: carboxypeptidase regulatory-like domain-containing protein [Bryobacteraceae bacterium]|nr:carboxypeptidase regulatory-like domain-containing protein [Bryobacteraceae bacterium]